MRVHRCATAALLSLVLVPSIRAQSVDGVPVPLPIAPVSAALVACQGGTGASVTVVATTVTLVCAAATSRSYWRIADMAAVGSGYVYCTDDGSAPSLTHWTFAVYPQGFQDTTGMQVVSPAALQCIAAQAATISALAVQTGVSP